MNKKDTNPKDAVGISKRPTSTIPTTVIAELGVAMLEGALKYGRHNYRVAGVRASVYKDALDRHMGPWWEGQDTDPDSGLHHITKAIATLTVLRDSIIKGNWVDDRPPKINESFWQELNEKTTQLIAKYPEPVAPYTEKGEREKAKEYEDRSFVDAMFTVMEDAERNPPEYVEPIAGEFFQVPDNFYGEVKAAKKRSPKR